MRTLPNNRTLLLTGFIAVISFVLVFAPIVSTFAAPPAQNAGLADVATDAAGIGISSWIGTSIGNFILYIGSMITGFGGWLLDASIMRFIVNISELLASGTNLGNAISNVWVLIRDICNLAFIFGFIYVGIRTILDADSSTTKRMLASIIIGALLINFSLFIAKAVIDVSNFVSVEIYKSLVNTSSGGTIATNFLDKLGLNGIWNVQNVQEFAQRTAGGNISFYFMATLLLIIAGFVFAAGAVLIMIRFVALILILCFSPVLFAATVFPATQKYASDMWHKLISYAFFAPAYLLLLVVSLNVLNGVIASIRPSGASMATAIAGINGTAGVLGNTSEASSIFLSFGVAIFFLIMSLQIATRFGVVGADRAIAFGNTLRGRGQKMLGSATFGLGAAAGRATIGRVANKYAESDWAKDKASQRGIAGWTARRALKGSRVVADTSFDARKIGGVGDKLGIGEGRKGGYKTVKDEVKKKEEEFAKSLGEIEDTDVQVKARKVEHSAEEKQLRLMEEQLNKARRDPAVTPATLASMREAIEDQKEAIEKAKARYEQEKMRRVVGSSYATPESTAEIAALKKHDDDVKKKEVEIKNNWNGEKDPRTGTFISLAYKDLSDADKELRRGNIELLNEQLDALKKAREKFVNSAIDDRGYAGVLERDTWYTSWPAGRLIRNNRYAGKKMREARQKGKPKDKDE